MPIKFVSFCHANPRVVIGTMTQLLKQKLRSHLVYLISIKNPQPCVVAPINPAVERAKKEMQVEGQPGLHRKSPSQKIKGRKWGL